MASRAVYSAARSVVRRAPARNCIRCQRPTVTALTPITSLLSCNDSHFTTSYPSPSSSTHFFSTSSPSTAPSASASEEVQVTRPPLSVSPRCAARLATVSAQRGTTVVLRVSVDGGGCSGFQYSFALEERCQQDGENHKEQTSDQVLIDGLVITDTTSLLYIAGSTVDYVEELISASFRITHNPNSESSCGCGVSFSPKL